MSREIREPDADEGDRRSSPDRRRVPQEILEHRGRLALIETRLDDGDKKFDALNEAVSENTKITEETKKAVAELTTNLAGAVKFFKVMDGAGEAGTFLGKLSLWVIAIFGAFGIVWLFFRYVVWEAIKRGNP